MKKTVSLLLVLFIAIFSFSACKNKEDVKDNENVSENITGKNPVATIEMEDGGVIKVELYYDKAPNTVKNFVSLANNGFYDGLIFHRVISGFMIQGGDPEGIGIGGPGYSIKGEFRNNGIENDIEHKRGVISMARSADPDSAGSQFFIMHQDAPHLDGDYAAFGMVISGIDVVDKIAAVETDMNDKPLKDVVIKSIKVDLNGNAIGEPETLPGR